MQRLQPTQHVPDSSFAHLACTRDQCPIPRVALQGQTSAAQGQEAQTEHSALERAGGRKGEEVEQRGCVMRAHIQLSSAVTIRSAEVTTLCVYRVKGSVVCTHNPASSSCLLPPRVPVLQFALRSRSQSTHHIQMLRNGCTFVELLYRVLRHARLRVGQHNRPAQAAVCLQRRSPLVAPCAHLCAQAAERLGACLNPPPFPPTHYECQIPLPSLLPPIHFGGVSNPPPFATT